MLTSWYTLEGLISLPQSWHCNHYQSIVINKHEGVICRAPDQWINVNNAYVFTLFTSSSAHSLSSSTNSDTMNSWRLLTLQFRAPLSFGWVTPTCPGQHRSRGSVKGLGNVSTPSGEDFRYTWGSLPRDPHSRSICLLSVIHRSTQLRGAEGRQRVSIGKAFLGLLQCRLFQQFVPSRKASSNTGYHLEDSSVPSYERRVPPLMIKTESSLIAANAVRPFESC